MKRKYAIVYLDSLRALKPLEAILYGYLLQFSKKAYDTKYRELAELLNITERQLRYTIDGLQRLGAIKVSRLQFGINIKVQTLQNCQVRYDKNVGSDMTNLSSRYDKNVNSDITNLSSHTLSNSNTINNSIRENSAPEEKEIEKTTEERRAEIILEGIKAQYEKNGSVYIPNWATQTTATSAIVGKLGLLLKNAGINDNEKEFSAAWQQFLAAGYKAGDEFDRTHWTLDYIDKQFMTIYNKIKNGNNTSKNNGTYNKGQRRFSNDFLTQQLQQAARAFQPEEPGEDVQGS